MLSTDRLILRQWQTSDLAPFTKMNADAEVMRFFPTNLTSEQSEVLFNQLYQAIEQYGIGFWATELKQLVSSSVLLASVTMTTYLTGHALK